MSTALIFIILAIILILGGAVILLKTAKPPKIPKNIKTPEEFDKEDEDYRQ